MKIYKTIILSVFSAALLFGSTSCLILHENHQQSTPNGWRKNSNNPHHPNTTNPGHTKGKGRR